MCTVSYLPIKGGYIVTSNRDESPDRAITQVASLDNGLCSIHFPKDPRAGGSWIGTSNDGRTVCLLNGAFEPFDISVKYADSRGTALIKAFDYDSLRAFANAYDLRQTAPFTMLMANGASLDQLIWDGANSHYSSLDPQQPHFWSSVTLYSPEVRARRQKLFDTWLSTGTEFNMENIVVFHEYGHEADSVNGFIMNRDERVKTLSITSAEVTSGLTTLLHRNLPETMSEAFKVVINHDALVRQV